MAQRIPTVKPREVVRVLEAAGFSVEHQTGSHMVMRHRANVMDKLSLHNRADLIKFAIRKGLVTLEE